jgi:tartrate-resistant acid phosphatase type 5
MKFTDLVEELSSDIWPEGVPENLVAPVRKNFASAAVSLQRYIPCFQEKNISRYPQCSTYYQRGMTVFDAPKGRIDRMYTVQADDEDYPAYFHQASKHEVECHAMAYIRSIYPPKNDGLDMLPLGFKYPEEDSDYYVTVSGVTSTKKSTKHFRAVTGLWAIENNKIWVSPWLSSFEVAALEWSGLKQTYGDEDIVYDSSDWKRAVRLYVHKEYARDYDSDYEKYKFLTVEYNESLADLLYECKKETEVKPFLYCDEAFDILTARRDAQRTAGTTDAVATTASYVFAQIGDFGASAGSGDYDGTNAGKVATLLKSWSPQFVVTTGDNSYNASGADMTTDTYDINVGQHYSEYIFPFGTGQSSTYTSTATENKFFPAVGNHDYVSDSLSFFHSYFTLPGNERYYDFIKGGVHFFCINSGIATDGDAVEPDALSGSSSSHRGEDSIMADWLQGKLAASSAHWKVVYFHHPPHSSDINMATNKGTVEMRWPFKEWDADIVLSGHGHQYERLKDTGNGDYPYIVNGAGGAPLRGYHSNALATGITSVLKYNTKHGAVRGTVEGDTLKFEFIDYDGGVQDTLTLTKARNATTTTYA